MEKKVLKHWLFVGDKCFGSGPTIQKFFAKMKYSSLLIQASARKKIFFIALTHSCLICWSICSKEKCFKPSPTIQKSLAKMKHSSLFFLSITYEEKRLLAMPFSCLFVEPLVAKKMYLHGPLLARKFSPRWNTLAYSSWLSLRKEKGFMALPCSCVQ